MVRDWSAVRARLAVLTSPRTVLCLTAFAGLSIATSNAATQTGNVAVAVTIRATCTVATTAISFGVVPNLNANRQANGVVTVRCTNTVPYAIGLGSGLYGASVTTRKLKHIIGAQIVNYNIFRNAARTLNWGNTVGTDTVAGTGNGAAQNVTVRGRIPGPQVVTSLGTYNDTVQVVVTY